MMGFYASAHLEKSLFETIITIIVRCCSYQYLAELDALSNFLPSSLSFPHSWLPFYASSSTIFTKCKCYFLCPAEFLSCCALHRIFHFSQPTETSVYFAVFPRCPFHNSFHPSLCSCDQLPLNSTGWQLAVRLSVN